MKVEVEWLRRIGCHFSLAVLVSLAGCTTLEPVSDETSDKKESSMWPSNVRQPTPPGSFLGIDDRAREIERNLGIR